MVLLPSLLLILACLTGSFGQKDLRNKVFVFPAPSAKAAVVLQVPKPQPITKLTVSLRYYTLLNRSFRLFSYATHSSENDFEIFLNAPDRFSIAVGGSAVEFKVALEEKPSWKHICVSWDSTNGLVQLWLNGEPLPRVGLRKGYTINTGGSFVLGQNQDQDNIGGGFDINQSFVGEILDVKMWPRVLTNIEIGLVKNNLEVPDPLID
ncbi:serum amyloid P-component-like [Erythrolamprus reginae]|uniref:serum amyloid P-component-like n=1 Tax=Erythrolamprus reginae TaxID=121349 RepID=UPI00396CEDC8